MKVAIAFIIDAIITLSVVKEFCGELTGLTWLYLISLKILIKF